MNAIMYIGIFMAGFLSLLIFVKREKAIHDYILVLWMILNALNLFSFYYDFNSQSRDYEALQLVGMVIPMAAAPVLYFYVCALVRSRPFQWVRYLYHFIPFLIQAGSLLYFYYNLSREQLLFVDDGYIQMANIPAFNLRYYGLIIAFFSFIYPTISLYMLFKHQKQMEHEFSSLERVNMKWLRNWILLSMIGFWLSFAVIWGGSFQWIEFTTSFQSVATMVTLNIAIIGFYGLKQTSIFTNLYVASDALKERITPKKYHGSNLDEQESEKITIKLLAYMQEEKPFQDAQLSLESLAGQLAISKHDLSQVINERLEVNFFTFVNQYRVNEFKALIQDPQFEHYTILGVALEAGFNSKSSFNSVFKKLEGITPGEYKNGLTSAV